VYSGYVLVTPVRVVAPAVVHFMHRRVETGFGSMLLNTIMFFPALLLTEGSCEGVLSHGGTQPDYLLVNRARPEPRPCGWRQVGVHAAFQAPVAALDIFLLARREVPAQQGRKVRTVAPVVAPVTNGVLLGASGSF
jgi:hypothetical protein